MNSISSQNAHRSCCGTSLGQKIGATYTGWSKLGFDPMERDLRHESSDSARSQALARGDSGLTPPATGISEQPRLRLGEISRK